MNRLSSLDDEIFFEDAGNARESVDFPFDKSRRIALQSGEEKVVSFFFSAKRCEKEK